MKITKKNIDDIQIWDGDYENYLIGYSIVCWPESQYLLDHEEINEYCYLINDEDGYNNYGPSAYVVDSQWLKINFPNL